MIPLALDSGPGGTVVGLSYMVNDGAEIHDDTGDSGQPLTSTALTFPEGRATLEYWGRWTNGIQQGHNVKNVLVDKTDPTVDVERPDGESIFVITRRETVDVHAADALSGLVQDPSGTGSSMRAAAATFTPTAADLCANQASDAFDYRVLAPGLGVRTVLERVSGRVRVRRRPAAAQASQRAVRSGAEAAARVACSLLHRREPRYGAADLGEDAARGSDPGRPLLEGRVPGAPVAQARARGLTDLRLKGGSFKRCTQRGTAGAGARAGSAGARFG